MAIFQKEGISYTNFNIDNVRPASFYSLLSKSKWYGLPGQRTWDAPVSDDDIPDEIKRFFNYTKVWNTAGFVKIDADYVLPMHEDNFLESQIEKYRDLLGDFYADWLYDTGNRNCSIMFPVLGDFKNVNTKLQNNTTGFTESFTLEHGAALFQTRDNISHGVDNSKQMDRVTFQLSFGEKYEYVRDTILAPRLT